MKKADRVSSIAEASEETDNSARPDLFKPFLFFIFASILLYFPVINRYFVSDDFKVLKRVCLDQTVLIKGFFRPLSDLSILLNYRIDGFNPVVFNLFNIIIHGANAFFVFVFCLQIGKKINSVQRLQFAWISSFFFLSFPFHNEAVVWMLGRGASLAGMFVLLAIISYYKFQNVILKMVFACVFYFVSISAFESTLLFPFFFLAILYFENENKFAIRKWMALLLSTTALHFVVRYILSGSILQSYGGSFFQSGIKSYLLNVIRVTGRLFFPPVANPFIFLASVSVLFVAGIGVFFKYRNKKNNLIDGRLIATLAILLSVSCVFPILTGVSTQTSETDRMLYLPSIFFCQIAGLLISSLIIKNVYRRLVIISILFYNIYFLEKNNMNWKTASEITSSIVKKIQMGNPSGKIYFLNIPNEIEGAYVFRMGFQDAVQLLKKDSSRFIALNFLPRQDLEKIKQPITLTPEHSVLSLPPDIILIHDSSGSTRIIQHGILTYRSLAGDQLYFWNFDHLQSIPNSLSGFIH